MHYKSFPLLFHSYFMVYCRAGFIFFFFFLTFRRGATHLSDLTYLLGKITPSRSIILLGYIACCMLWINDMFWVFWQSVITVQSLSSLPNCKLRMLEWCFSFEFLLLGWLLLHFIYHYPWSLIAMHSVIAGPTASFRPQGGTVLCFAWNS